MFIQRDPIGLLGGNNVFAYAPNPIHWIDVFGLKRSKRSEYMGKTPAKHSATGRDVALAMLEKGQLRGVTEEEIRAWRKADDISRNVQFWGADKDGNFGWHSIKDAHMGQLESAVDFWNRCGRYHGKRSSRVREFMKTASNYVFQLGSANCSAGGKDKARYQDVATNLTNPDC